MLLKLNLHKVIPFITFGFYNFNTKLIFAIIFMPHL